MKSCCSLNNVRAADYDIETKCRICSACIDNDHIDCKEGALNITAYKKQKENEKEFKKNLIAAIQIGQQEIKKLESELGIHR